MNRELFYTLQGIVTVGHLSNRKILQVSLQISWTYTFGSVLIRDSRFVMLLRFTIICVVSIGDDFSVLSVFLTAQRCNSFFMFLNDIVSTLSQSDG